MRTASSPADDRQKRRKAERLGRVAEFVAAGYLMAKGYRILGRRVRTRYGEIDLIGVRGHRLAFVEVKYRDGQADMRQSVSGRQADRLADAAEKWASDHPAYRNYSFGLDAIYIVPWQLPRHDIDGLQAH